MYPVKLPILLTLSLLSLIPAQSVAQDRVLVLPFAGMEPSETINHYEAPMTEYGAGHRGIDLPATIGDQLVSPANGSISFVGKVGYRNVISIAFGNSFIASIEPVCSDLLEGTPVVIGEPIGMVCEPDIEYVWHCQTTCLHFGTRSAEGYFSPLALVGGLGPSKLAYYARG